MWGWLLPVQSQLFVVKSNERWYLVFVKDSIVCYYCYTGVFPVSIDRQMQVAFVRLAVNGNISFLPKLASFLRCWDSTVGCKLKFKRKGSWMRIRRVWPSSISLKVGLGHYQRIGSLGNSAIRYKKHLRRHSIFLIGLRWREVASILKQIRSYRPMNACTKRGVRLGRQLFYRRQGKQSKYTALKSKIF